MPIKFSYGKISGENDGEIKRLKISQREVMFSKIFTIIRYINFLKYYVS
jgi:hypothetical protein